MPTIIVEPTRADLDQYQINGLRYLSDYVQQVGQGSYRDNRIFHCGATLFEPLVRGFGLDVMGIKVKDFLAFSYDSFGYIDAITCSGDDISIDPIDKSITVIRGDGERLDGAELEFQIATNIGQELRDIDEDISEFDDYHTKARRELGDLEYGECYGLTKTFDDPNERTIQDTKIVPIIAHILELRQRSPFELSDIEYDDEEALPTEEAWGTYLDEIAIDDV